MRKTMRTRLWVLAVSVGALATPLLAQQPDEKPPPFYDVPALEDRWPWVQWVVGTVFIAALLMIALRNPHRSHLD